MKKNFAIIILLLTTLVAFGQPTGSIAGVVADAQSYKPLEAATVELIKMPDSTLLKAVITSPQGEYSFSDIPLGKYMVRISFIGHQPEVLPNIVLSPEKAHLKFGKTALIVESQTLDEVSIVARKLTGVLDDNKTIYNINEKSATMAQSGLDLLRQVPDINVDYMNNDVMIEGMKNIQFQVNGKKVDKEYLMQLNPKIIDKVETITNPGVKYDADVDAVINIILKSNNAEGMSARTSVEIPFSTTNFFSNNNFSIDYFKNGFRVFAGGQVGLNRWDISQNTNRIQNATTLDQNFNGDEFNKYGSLNYGFDWFINEKNNLSFSGNYKLPLQNTDESTVNEIFNDGTNNLRYNRAFTTNDNVNKYTNYSMFYQHKFNTTGHEISLESRYLNNANEVNSENRREDYNPTTDSVYNAYTLLQDKLDTRNQTTIKLDYNYPITQSLMFVTGVHTHFYRTTNNFKKNTSNINNILNYDENQYAAYGNFSWKNKIYNIQTGVRYEMSDINIMSQNDTASNYNVFLPFASIQMKAGKKNTLRLNYRSSIRRPSLSEINPFDFSEDNRTVSRGNPNLEPSKYHRLEFSHRYTIMGPIYISYKPYMTYANNGIQSITLATSDSSTMKTYENTSQSLEYGVNVSAGLALSKWWMINPNYTYFHKDIAAAPQYGITALNKNSWRIGVSSQILLPKEWVIFVNYNYQNPNISYQTVSESQYMFVTGFNKTYKKSWNFTVFTINPWENKFMFNNTIITADNLVQKSIGTINYNYIISFRVGYTFNKGKEIKKIKRNNENNEEPVENSGKGLGGM